MAWMYDSALALKTTIGSVTSPVIDAIQIVPDGHGRDRPEEAKTRWVNIEDINDDTMDEVATSYRAEFTHRITLLIDDQSKSLETTEQNRSLFVEAVLNSLRFSGLPVGGTNFAREVQTSKFWGKGEYLYGDDNDAVYGYQIEVTVPKQL